MKTNRRTFLAATLGLALLPSTIKSEPGKQDKIDWICENYAELSNEDKQQTLDLIISRAVKRKDKGDMKEANALAYLAVHLVQNYGGLR